MFTFSGEEFFSLLERVIVLFTNFFTIVPMFNSMRFLNFLVFVSRR